MNYKFPKEWDKFFVGFDPMMNRIAENAEKALKLTTNYPPYNIKQIDDNRYVIEMAVAGFSKSDLELEFVDSKLIVKGNVQAGDEMEASEKFPFPLYLHNGLASRPFTREFTLADNVEVKGSELFNGILKIWLEAVPTESRKVKIDING